MKQQNQITVLYTNTEYQLETTRVLFFPMTEEKLGDKYKDDLYLLSFILLHFFPVVLYQNLFFLLTQYRLQ